MFFNDLSEACSPHICDYALNNLLFPLCERARHDKTNGKQWKIEDFAKNLQPKFESFYDCRADQAPNLFQHLMTAIIAKLPVYMMT
jgi:hypothetical protein